MKVNIVKIYYNTHFLTEKYDITSIFNKIIICQYSILHFLIILFATTNQEQNLVLVEDQQQLAHFLSLISTRAIF